MAKRELITREEAIKTVSRWIKSDMILGSSLFEMMMNEIPPITEQEIVKPYLEKLKTDIEKKHTKAKQRGWVLQMNAYTDCLQMIDNLLSESEGK